MYALLWVGRAITRVGGFAKHRRPGHRQKPTTSSTPSEDGREKSYRRTRTSSSTGQRECYKLNMLFFTSSYTQYWVLYISYEDDYPAAEDCLGKWWWWCCSDVDLHRTYTFDLHSSWGVGVSHLDRYVLVDACSFQLPI